ncbi:hypothetical protein NEHOM01_0122 [Nematocida homosporus]|uniref:uncharacterized protein n=1 Tax=Nematocida homosporus TaxID=1912981 RepID=UPI00221EAF7F|nr:uncharacterized protein NEHOM01_0122 [Nematocida homosporus]KAI5184377.1 hypothetical protein NEHOM01_0122 [Nematocida homosporus]
MKGPFSTLTERYLDRLFENRKSLTIEKLILSLEDISSTLPVPIKSELLGQVKKNFFAHRGIYINREQMKKILEVIIKANAGNSPITKSVIDDTIRGPPDYGLETNNTIIVGDKDGKDESQLEFKSIINDIDKGVEKLEEQTVTGMGIHLGNQLKELGRNELRREDKDSFLEKRIRDRNRRTEELRAIKETDICSKRYLDTTMSQMGNNQHFSEVIGKISDILAKKEPVTESYSALRGLKEYETNFNNKMITLLNELSDKIPAPSTPSPKPANPSDILAKYDSIFSHSTQPVNPPTSDMATSTTPITPLSSPLEEVVSPSQRNTIPMLGIAGVLGGVLGLVLGLVLKSSSSPY